MNVVESHSLWHASVWGPLRNDVSRTALSIVAIALGVALGFAIDAMNRAAIAEMTAASRSLFGQADLVVKGSSQGFNENLYTTVAHIKGVRLASPVVQVDLRIPNTRESIALLGIDFLRATQVQPTTMSGNGSNDAHTKDRLAIFDPNNLILSASAARALHANVNDVVTLQLGAHTLTFMVTGILPSAAYSQPVGLLDIAAAQWRLDRLGVVTRIDVYAAAGEDLSEIAKRIESQLPAGVIVTTPTDISQQSAQLSRSFTVNLTALALVALFTGAFLVYATQSLAITRRRREFALLHALGVTHRQQMLSVVMTGGLLGIVGASLGIALGALLAKYSIQLFLGNLNVINAPRLQFSPWMTAAFFLLGVGVSVAGSIAPAIAAAKIPTARALKSGDMDIDVSRGSANRIALATVIGVSLWLVAPLLLLIKPIQDLPLSGYVSIALVLIGAVFLIPAVTRRLIQWLPQRGNVVYQVAVAQLRGTASKATVSVATILVSVSLMAAMGIMVNSLRGSFIDSLDRMLPANIYVNAGGATSNYIDAATAKTISRVHGVARAEPTRTIEIVLSKNRPPITLIARPISEGDARDKLLLEAQARHSMSANTLPVWISVALADHYALNVDDEFTLPLGAQTVRASVRGIWRDNGRLNDAVMIDIERYRQLTHDERVNSLAIWLADDAAAETTMNAIRGSLDKDAMLDIGLPQEQRALRLSVFDRVFAVTYLLELVAVVIGLFGIGVSSSAQALARRAEFGVLRHLGFTRIQIARLLLTEGFGLGALGALTGLCVGSVISLILIYVIGRQSFHWMMDIHVPYFALLALTCIIPVAASLTAMWSGRAAMNADVIGAVKEDW